MKTVEHIVSENESQAQSLENKNVSSLVSIEDGRIFTTSLVVAEVFEKNHKDVLRAIENLECSKEFHERNFAPMVYTAEIGSGAKREFPAYNLTRDGFSILVMGFTGKKAMEWKEKFLEAFNKMEATLRQAALKDVSWAEPRRTTPLFHRNLDFPRKKCTTRQQNALRDLITLWCYVEGCTEAEAEALLLQSLRVPALRDLQQTAFLEASRIAWRCIFQRSDFLGAPVGNAQNARVLHSVLRTWEFYCGHDIKNITDYVCQACQTSSLTELSEKDTHKAILAAFMGFIERFPGESRAQS